MIEPIIWPILVLVVGLWLFETGYTLGWEARSLHQHGRRLNLMLIAKRRLRGLIGD